MSQVPRLTQEALAKRLGVTGVAVSRWESGERAIDADLVPTVSNVTGLPPEVLRRDLARLMGAHQ